MKSTTTGFGLRHRLLDRLCLLPSRHPLERGLQQRIWWEDGGRRLEIFRQIKPAGASQARELSDPPGDESSPVDGLIIKWSGNAGRAELSTVHPAQAWPELSLEVWTVNPPGYGQSPGTASLAHIPWMAEALQQLAQRRLPGVGVLVFGNSIGGLTALWQAGLQENGRPWGVFLRNPPPLLELIRQHYHRWYYGPVTRWLTGGSAPYLDAVTLAARCPAPLFLLQSGQDREVPPEFQDLIYDAHPGPKFKYRLPDAGHNDLPTANEPTQRTYLAAIRNFFGNPP